MRQKHDFSYLIKEYQTSYTLEATGKGSYADNGDFIPGAKTDPEQRQGLILFMSNEDIQIAANGKYSRQDIKVYETKDVPMDSMVVYRGVKYMVNEKASWDEYSDFNIFFCKKVASQ